jgi:serine protease Do
MSAFLLRAILACALTSTLCQAQIGPAALGAGAAWQIQQMEVQPRPAGSYLGVKLSDIDAERARVLKLSEERGVEVKTVEEGSPADHAGIQAGDVLLSYNGENILGAQQLIRLVQETPVGRKVKLQFWREGKANFAVITTGSPPSTTSAPGAFPNFPSPATASYLVPKAILVWRSMLAGIEFEELDSQLSEYFGVPGGVLIRWVEKDSPAQKSGLKSGDVIVAVRHKTVVTTRDFNSCLRQPSATTILTLVRNHKKLDVTLAVPEAQ